MTRDEIKAQLQTGIFEVTFTKVDGSVRVMPCTLKEDILPVAPSTESKRTKAPNETNLSVWCTDKAEWRSFKVANVTSIKAIS